MMYIKHTVPFLVFTLTLTLFSGLALAGPVDVVEQICTNTILYKRNWYNVTATIKSENGEIDEEWSNSVLIKEQRVFSRSATTSVSGATYAAGGILYFDMHTTFVTKEEIEFDVDALCWAVIGSDHGLCDMTVEGVTYEDVPVTSGIGKFIPQPSQ